MRRWLLFGLSFPIFFVNIPPNQLRLASGLGAVQKGIVIPGSMIVAGLLVIRLLLRILSGAKLPKTSNALAIGLMWFINSVILLLGLWKTPGFLNGLFFVQLSFPAAMYFVGLDWSRNSDDLKLDMMAFAAGPLIALTGMLAQTIITDGISSLAGQRLADKFWIFGVPQAYGYFPIMIAVVYSICLGLYFEIRDRTQGHMHWLLPCFFILLLLPALWSRGAFATVILISILHLLIRLRIRVKKHHFIRSLSLSLLVAFIGIVIGGMMFLSSRQPIVLERLIDMRKDPTIAAADVRRLDAAIGSLSIVKRSPLLGLMYVPQRSTTLTGKELAVGRVAYPHNQYLDIAVKTGVLSTGLFIWILVTSVRNAWYVFKNATAPVEKGLASAIWTSLFSIALVSNFLQVNFTQPYTGLALYFLIGVSDRLSVRIRRGNTREERLLESTLPVQDTRLMTAETKCNCMNT